jgi:hypothetical protein
MPPLEKELEQLLVNFPNLVNSYLWGRKFPEVYEFGGTNVCVRQGPLPECNGRVDVAFITDSSVHAVELKRGAISVAAFNQLKRYLAPLQERYPNHLIVGYLVGRRGHTRDIFRSALANERINVLLVGHEIPRANQLRTCTTCRAAYHYKHHNCPYCTEGSR